MLQDRPIYQEDHRIFRQSVRTFFERELTPNIEKWEKAGIIDRDFYLKSGEAGLLCPGVPEQYGGFGADFLYHAVVAEELAYQACSGPGFGVHSDICAYYLIHYGSEEQKQTWLPKMVSGEVVAAIAMSEPAAGSDLQGIKTTAKRDGNHYVINGSKTFITNGQHADIIITVAKTDPEKGAHGISLIIIEADRDGFSKGRNLDKMGQKSADTSELFFDNVRVPITNCIGEENQGFIYLMQELPQERLSIALSAMGAAQKAYDITTNYVKERQAFGKPIFGFQNTRFKLAELKTDLTAGWALTHECLAELMDKKLTVEKAAMVKLWTTEMQGRLVDACVQLHGGYGYMNEYEIARIYVDSRVQRIYGGTTEIMKELISRHI